MMSNILNQIIKEKANCVIVPHKSPDGDCLGSSLTLSNFFRRNGCEVKVIIDEVIPTNFKFLNIQNTVKSIDILDSKLSIDYLVILDTSDIERVGFDKAILKQSKTVVVIDHHKTNTMFGDYNIVEMTSSVGELIYKNYVELGYEFDKIDAIGLYTAIITDTGNLRYSNTTSATLEAVSSLFKTGFDFSKTNQEIYGNQEMCKIKLNSLAVSKVETFFDGKIAVFEVTQEMLKETGSEMFHSDGIVETGRDIAGVEVSVLLKEINDTITKVSMRSKEYFDVSDIALLNNGGGHAKAAGCTFNISYKEAKEILIKLISEKLK